MSALDPFFANGMSVYKPETSHLRTEADFISAVPPSKTQFDEHGQPLRREPEEAIRHLSIRYFLWQARLCSLCDEGAPQAMKVLKTAIGDWCAIAGREDLAKMYKKEAIKEYENLMSIGIEKIFWFSEHHGP